MLLLPVLRKELIELAAQKRTYWIRATFTVGLCCVVGIALKVHYDVRPDFTTMLGQGATFFEVMTVCALCGIGFFLPILIADTIPAERERGALELLVLTRLTSLELVIEKFVSRLWPMMTMLLVGLPVSAVCYTFGGLTVDGMCAVAYLVLLFLFQIGAWSMVWAVLFRSTIGAFLASVVSMVVVLFLIPGIVYQGVFPAPTALHYLIDGAQEAGLAATVAASWWGWIPVVASLAFAWWVLPFTLVQRPRRPKRLQATGDRIGDDAPRGAVPENDPLAWREGHRGRAGAKIAAFVIALAAVAVAVMFAVDTPARANSDFAVTLVLSAWGIAAMAMLVCGVNLVASERANQTLEPILTLPLTGREIMRQKIAGLRPLVIAFVALIWMLVLAEAIHEGPTPKRLYHWSRAQALFTGLMLPVVMVPLLAHWGAFVGLFAKSRLRGLMIAIAGLIVWTMFTPTLLLLAATGGGANGLENLLYLSPPIPILSAAFRSGPSSGGAVGPVLFTLLWHGGMLALLRSGCGLMADRWLGRVEPEEELKPR